MLTTTKYKDFEDYLKWVHSADYADGVLDDDLPDHFDNWLADLNYEELIRFADDYAKVIRQEAHDWKIEHLREPADEKLCLDFDRTEPLN